MNQNITTSGTTTDGLSKRMGGRWLAAVLMVLCAWLAVAEESEEEEAPPVIAEGGSAVVVVYNTELPESKEVADYYVLRRGVPAEQVIGLALPLTEQMTRRQFVENLRDPFLAELQERQLIRLRDKPDARWVRVSEAKFRYALLCYGVPTKIQPEPPLGEPGTEELRVELKRNEASVDNELAALPRGPYALTGILTNYAYQATNRIILHPTNGILMVTRLDGPTVAIAKGLVDLALAGETNGLYGRTYIDARGLTEGPYKLGDQWLMAAAYVSERLGFETEVDVKPETFPPGYPLSHVAFYAGWYDTHASGPFTRSKVDFMPGAFAYHLHSFSAETIRSTNLNWVGPLLAKGAAASMGSVYEPYLTGTPDIWVFFSRFIREAFSFGEAAYASQAALSWQNIAVGDPLYRPFALNPEQRHQRLVARKSPLLEWSHLTAVNLNLATDVGEAAALEYLRDVPLTRTSAILMEKRASMYEKLRQLANAIEVYNEVLKLNPSPEQKKRVMLKLGEMVRYYGRSREAYEIYQQFVKEFPDYPDLVTIYGYLATLATNLNRPEMAEQYRKEVNRLSPKGSTR